MWFTKQSKFQNQPEPFNVAFSFFGAQRELDLRLQKQDLIFASSIILHNAWIIIGPDKMFFFSSTKWALVEWKQSQPPHHKVHGLWVLILFLIRGEITLGVRKIAQPATIMSTHIGSTDQWWLNTNLFFKMNWA